VQFPQLTIDRHEGELGWWEMASRSPHPLLAGQVLRYCGYRERTSEPFRRLEAPFNGVVLILSFGEPLRLVDAEGSHALHHSFTGGLSDGPTYTEHPGHQHGIQIDLTPPAARALLGMPLRELTNRVVSLEDVLGPAATELIERLYELPNWHERFRVLDSFLAQRLESGSDAVPSSLRAAWSRLMETRGRVEIEALAQELGYSRRHLSARFGEQLGLPPKTYARVLRFEHAAERLSHDSGARFAEIAQDCGYYDQAHLNRDFREFAGTTPGDYVGRLLPGGGGVAATEELPFVQDAPPLAA
jgi:AraC-like DNA-binding protein